MRRFIWRGTGDHKQEAGAEVPYLYETERSRSGKGWLLGMQFCALLEDDTYEK